MLKQELGSRHYNLLLSHMLWLSMFCFQSMTQNTFVGIYFVSSWRNRWVFFTWVFLDKIKHSLTSKHHVFPLVSRLKHYEASTRNNSSIVVMNFPNRRMDISEHFHCKSIPDSRRNYEDSRDSETSAHDNLEVHLRCVNLSRATWKINIVHANTKSQRGTLNSSVKKHQEENLGLTLDDFKLKCLPPETSQHLLNKSLECEKDDLPELCGSDMRADFKK